MSEVLEVGRYEIKAIVPRAMRSLILEYADPHLQTCPFTRDLGNGEAGYWVHSVYFDTTRLDDYFERLDERRVRNRLRVRSYGAPGQGQPLFLENKRKVGKWVVKQRVLVGDADSWCDEKDPVPWPELAKHAIGRDAYAASSFCRLVDQGSRIPVSVVHYQREAMVPRGVDTQEVRLTLDCHVGATVSPAVTDLYSGVDVTFIPDDFFVLELKFNRSMPSWMRMMLRECRIVSEPVSKFGLSVAVGLRAGYPRELRQLQPRLLRTRDGLPRFDENRDQG